MDRQPQNTSGAHTPPPIYLQPQSTSGARTPSPTFTIKSGTVNVGKNYEHLLIAHIILKLVTNDDIEDFWLSSNNDKFGTFDDVVIEIKYRNSKKIVTYAVQLKHNDKGKLLTTTQLAGEKGDFGINKYYKDYCKLDSLNKESVQMILFTNCKFTEESNFSLKLNLGDKVCDVEGLKNQTDELISTGGCCFSFKSDKEYIGFFKNFCLYTSQLNVETLRTSCSDKFKEMFSCDDENSKSIFNEYLNYITEWSNNRKPKDKLNKSRMRRMILLRVLSPFVQTLSYKEKHLNPKMELLYEAVSTFQVTVFYERANWEQFGIIWEQATIDEINKTNKIYQVTTHYFAKVDELNMEDIRINKLLWLMGKCPLVIEGRGSGVEKALDLLRDEKFIILTPDFDVNKSLKRLKRKQNGCFECLSDLKSATKVYDGVLDKFVVSIEGQTEATLREIILAAQEVESYFKTDTLLKLVNDPLLGGRNDNSELPEHYVPRTLTRIIMDSQYLEEFNEETLIIVTHVTEMATFKRRCQENEIDILSDRSEQQTNVKQIYVTADEGCSQEKFNELFKKQNKSNCHQFRYINSAQLEWIRSKNGVSELKKYRLEDTQNIKESELFDYSNNNLINIICENPGMGKTTLMKSLKCATPSMCWTIVIFARNCAEHFRENKDNVEKFFEFIEEDICKGYPNLDRIILSNFLKYGKTQIVWDGMDEISDDTLEIITEMIVKIKKQGIKQWLTSRILLKDKLEQKFDVFSRSIQEFSNEEQTNYIKKRIPRFDINMHNNFTEIKFKIDLSSNSIFGIPLQIFMLTELLLEDKDALKSLSSIADLYKHFVERKFFKHYKEKTECDLNNFADYNNFEKYKFNKINEYKKIAIHHYLKLNDITKDCQKLFRKIQKEKDASGFIIKVTKDMTPQFLHSSYGEYFAALYFTKNYRKLPEDKDFYFHNFPELTNICLFADLIFAKNCKAHIAVLSNNSQSLDKCTDEQINLKDEAGRTCLEISFKFVKKYPIMGKLKSLNPYQFRTYMSSDKCLKRFSELKENEFSELLKKFNKNTLKIKKLILLFPFVLLFFKEKGQIDKKVVYSILYYAIEFNHKKVLEYLDFPYTLSPRKNKKLFDQAVRLERIDFIKRLFSNQEIIDNVTEDLKLWYELCAIKSTELLHICETSGCDLDKEYKYFFFEEETGRNEKIWTVAHYVCSKTKDTPTLKFLIENCADVNLTDSFGNAPIHMAYKNSLATHDMIAVLIVNKANLTVTDPDGNLPLHLACKFRYFDHDIVKDLIEKGGGVNISNKAGQLPIHLACMNKRCGYELIKILVSCGAEVDEFLLHYACKNGRKQAVECLVELGAEVNVFGHNGKMPIHLACENQESGRSIVKYLVERGCNVNIPDANGYFPIHLACMNEKCGRHIVDCLLDGGSSVNHCDKNENMPIHIACENGGSSEDIVKCLIERDCDSVKHSNKNKSFPIHLACKNEECGSNIIKFLVVYSRDVINVSNADGYYPIHLACMNEKCGRNIIEYLVENGSSVNCRDKKGNLPIHIACKKWCGKDIVKYLIKKDSNVNVSNEDGNYPIHLACTNVTSGYDIVKLLVENGADVNVTNRDGKKPVNCVSDYTDHHLKLILLLQIYSTFFDNLGSSFNSLRGFFNNLRNSFYGIYNWFRG